MLIRFLAENISVTVSSVRWIIRINKLTEIGLLQWVTWRFFLNWKGSESNQKVLWLDWIKQKKPNM